VQGRNVCPPRAIGAPGIPQQRWDTAIPERPRPWFADRPAAAFHPTEPGRRRPRRRRLPRPALLRARRSDPGDAGCLGLGGQRLPRLALALRPGRELLCLAQPVQIPGDAARGQPHLPGNLYLRRPLRAVPVFKQLGGAPRPGAALTPSGGAGCHCGVGGDGARRLRQRGDQYAAWPPLAAGAQHALSPSCGTARSPSVVTVLASWKIPTRVLDDAGVARDIGGLDK